MSKCINFNKATDVQIASLAKAAGFDEFNPLLIDRLNDDNVAKVDRKRAIEIMKDELGYRGFEGEGENVYPVFK